MRERWKQAGLVLLSTLVVWLAFEAYKWLADHVLAVSDIKVFVDEAAVVYFATYLAAVRWIERRIPTEFSVHGALPVLGAGVLAGLALFSLLMAALWFAGVYRPDGWGDFNGLQLGFVLVFWLAVATQEEIFYRGLVFRLCSKVFGTWGALLLSAVFFSVKHMVGTPQPTVATFLGIAIAGVMLAAAYAATGRLWLPIGLHFGWNFAEGTLFGTQVSGGNLGFSLIQGNLIGPNILSGGQFGPEASIVAWIILLPAVAWLLWQTAKLRRTETPIWLASSNGTASRPASAHQESLERP